MAIRTKYGLQADAWGALVMDRAELVEEVEELTVQNLKNREIDKLTIKKEDVSLNGSTRRYLVAHQKLEAGGEATTLFRVVPRSKDLVVSWRLFEKNPGKELRWTGAALALACLGGFTLFVGICVGLMTSGVGFCCASPVAIMLPAAFGLWRLGRVKTTASATEQFDSRLLSNTVHWALMRALASNQIADQQVYVLQQARAPGLGWLMPTDVVEELTATPKLAA